MNDRDLFRVAFENAAIGISILAAEPLGKYLEANPTFCRMTGYSREELLARDFQSITAPQDLNRNVEQIETLLAGRSSALQIEKRYIRKDGGSFWARVNVSLVRDAGRKPLYLIVQIEDIDQQMGAREALKVSVSLLQGTLDSTADGILVVDRSGKIVSFNRQFVRMWELPSEVLDSRDDDQALAWVLNQLKEPEQFLRKVRELYAQPEAESYDVLEFKDGRVFERFSQPQRIEGQPVGRVWNFRDVTQRRKLEEDLRHAQKLEAIGQLAGGVAHEFNNILTAILGNLDLVTRRTLSEPDRQSVLSTARDAAERAAALTRQLLTFGRQAPIDLHPLDLGAVARDVVGLLRQTIDRRIEIESESQEELWAVLADVAQMNQVMMNLGVNARDALLERMENEADRGPDWEPRITVKAENVHLDASLCRSLDARPGEYVSLSVSDNGCGIDEQIRHRIFEPFFTTKEVGRGTGLGLASAYGITRQHQGWIEFDTVINEGSTFRVYLPRTDRPPVPMVQPALEQPTVRGSETILLVDDEPTIRRLGQRILEEEGYTVLLARDGIEALDLFSRSWDRIALVILDLTMPRQSGREVLRRLRELNPTVKVIVSSGHHTATDEKKLREFPGLDFIPKPYRTQELAWKVRQVLDQV